jgi:phytanoyl-CoA hydroxylase
MSDTEIMIEPEAGDAARFAADGYLVLRRFCAPAACEAIAVEVREALHPVLGPAEFEADVGYPGAPESRAAPGGNTPRRLLHAYSRFAGLRALATGTVVKRHLQAILGTLDVRLSQCHHNCVMTKSPGFSSATRWHQDIRYWSFERPELVSLWIALGCETAANGALAVIPGSHRLPLAAARLDEAKFLRPEEEENRSLIATARTVELAPGDALLFHCRTVHAAGRNTTERVKLSAVFTYHAADNRPLPGTRSAHYEGIAL